MIPTAAQIRAGRALVDKRQRELAEAAKVSVSTLLLIEHDRRGGLAETVDRIRRALEAWGVRFTETGGVEPR